MAQLESYLPEPRRPIPVHGDGASILSMLKAKNIKSSCLPMGRHRNIAPVMGEFHRRMIHLQDAHDILQCGATNDRGTLANQKVVFNIEVIT